MSEEFLYNKEKLSFREIVLHHLQKILELSAVEFRGGYKKQVLHPHHTEWEYVPSTKKSYIQCVEHLAYVLLPFFDKEMEECFEAYQDEVKNMRKNYIEKREKRIMEDFEFKVRKAKQKGIHPPGEIELEEALREAAKIGDKEEQMFVSNKLELCQELFQELNLLLNRIDYLKSSVYSEADLEEQEDIVDTDKRE